MHPTEIAFKIMVEMDEINEVTHRWSACQFGKLQANIQMLQNNGVEFTPSLICALAAGHEEDPEVLAAREASSLHFKHLDEVLDELYETQAYTHDEK